VILVASPLVGCVARTGLERTIGTVLGELICCRDVPLWDPMTCKPVCGLCSQSLSSGPLEALAPPLPPPPGGALALAAVYTRSTTVICLLGFLATLLGYFAGAKYGREYSGKLFPLTFLIVGPAGLVAENPVPLCISRIAGILSGILLMFMLSMVFFPRSASDKVGWGGVGCGVG